MMATPVPDGGRYPAAIWDPIEGRDTAPNRVDRMVIHTAWADSADIYGPRKGQGRTYAHFYNPTSGDMRQHQEIHRLGRALLYGNGRAVDVEHQDERRDMPLSESQIDNDARLFAYLVTHHGLPNRIATPDDTRGLAWHRLGCTGNYGRFDRDDPRTWSRAQTGERWSDVHGKTCPTNPRILQIPEIYALAQTYINRGNATAPTPTQEDIMTPEQEAKLDRVLALLEQVDGALATGVASRSIGQAVSELPSKTAQATLGALLNKGERRGTVAQHIAATAIDASQAVDILTQEA